LRGRVKEKEKEIGLRKGEPGGDSFAVDLKMKLNLEKAHSWLAS